MLRCKASDWDAAAVLLCMANGAFCILIACEDMPSSQTRSGAREIAREILVGLDRMGWPVAQ